MIEFLLAKAYLGLTLSWWWIVPFGIILPLAFVLPGGTTLMLYILSHNHLMNTLPSVVWKVVIIKDIIWAVLCIGGIIWSIVESRKKY